MSKPVSNASNANANASTSSRKPGPARKEPAYPGASPFSSVLAEYMWQSRDARNRPLGVGQLAIRLGVPRPTLNTWVHRNVVPDLDVVLDTLRILNIPVERLFAFYRAAGIPLPPLTQAEADAAQPAAAQPAADEGPTAPTRAAVPAAGWPALPPTATVASPKHASAAATGAADAWDATIASTVASLREAGVPESAIAATVERIRATQAGQSQPPQMARHVAAEHANEQHTDEQHANEQHTDEQQQKNNRTIQRPQPTRHGTDR